MLNNSNYPVLRLPTRDDNDADYLAIALLLFGAYLLFGIVMDYSAGQVIKPLSVLMCALILVSGPLIWRRVPYSNWVPVITLGAMVLKAASFSPEHGFSSSVVIIVICGIYAIYSFLRMDFRANQDRPEPDDETVGYVEFYIDQIHALDWPDDNIESIEFFNHLPQPQKTLWATWIYQMDVDKGGHSQYFFNVKDASYITECLKGLTDIGAIKILKNLNKALSVPKPHIDELNTSENRKDWIGILDKHGLRQKLWKPDNNFFNLKAEFYELRKIFIQNNSECFETLGKYSQTSNTESQD